MPPLQTLRRASSPSRTPLPPPLSMSQAQEEEAPPVFKPPPQGSSPAPVLPADRVEGRTPTPSSPLQPTPTKQSTPVETLTGEYESASEPPLPSSSSLLLPPLSPNWLSLTQQRALTGSIGHCAPSPDPSTSQPQVICMPPHPLPPSPYQRTVSSLFKTDSFLSPPPLSKTSPH